MDKGERALMTELETSTLAEPSRARKRPGPKPKHRPGPKPRARRDPAANGHVNGAAPAGAFDPIGALRQHLARLTVESTRLDAESTRVKRALQALQA